MLGRRAAMRRVRRRRRLRIMVAGAVVVGAANAMVKLTHKDAEKIQQTTGKAPEDMSEEELQQAMQQAGVQAQPLTPEDQQAMDAAEAADPDQE